MTLRTARTLLQPKDAVKWRVKNDTTERSIDAVEAFHLANGAQYVRPGRRRLDLTVSIHVQGEGDGDARAAWKALRMKHPAMASTVQGSKRVYNDRENDGNSFVEIESGEITPQLLDSLPAPDIPTLYVLSNGNEKGRVFALRTPQHLVDPLGAIMLLNDFLTLLHHTPTDDPGIKEKGKLSRSMKENASLPSASVAQLARLWNIRRRWLRSFPSVGVVPDWDTQYEDEFPSSGASSWRDLTYSKGSSKEVVAKARKHGVSVTHVLHAGVAFAAKEYGPFTLTRNYSSLILLDMRRRSPSQGDGGKSGGGEEASSQHALWPVCVPVTSFWRTAEQFKNAYEETVNDPDFLALVEPALAETAQTVLPSECSVPVLSSCGVIDDYLSEHNDLKVTDFSLSMECSGDEIVVAVWSFQGRLRVRALYNEGFHSGRSIERYLHLIQLALRDGVGVSPFT